MNIRRNWPLWLGVVLFALTVAFIAAMFLSQVRAHQAASGWTYPWQCCSSRDCRPVECDTLEEIGDGKVRDIENGQTYDREKVFSSGDSRCHVCTELGKLDGKGICAFTVTGF